MSVFLAFPLLDVFCSPEFLQRISLTAPCMLYPLLAAGTQTLAKSWLFLSLSFIIVSHSFFFVFPFAYKMLCSEMTL